MRAIIGLAVACIFGLFVFALFGPFYTIDEGERGVITRNGAITSVATPGFGVKLPMVDAVNTISIRSELIRIEGLQAYSQDQQVATMMVSVNYRVVPDKVAYVYSTYGSAEGMAERLIRPRVNDELKGVFGQFTAATAIAQREKLSADVKAAIAAAVDGPIIIEGIQLENIDFSDAYEQAIEDRMQAEVKVAKAKETAKEAFEMAIKARNEADGIAQSNLLKATADAEGIRLKGEAEASAVRAMGQALKDNPSVIEYRSIGQGWDGKLPTTMIPGSTVPFVSVK